MSQPLARLSSRGWSVFPCVSRTNRPFCYFGPGIPREEWKCVFYLSCLSVTLLLRFFAELVATFVDTIESSLVSFFISISFRLLCFSFLAFHWEKYSPLRGVYLKWFRYISELVKFSFGCDCFIFLTRHFIRQRNFLSEICLLGVVSFVRYRSWDLFARGYNKNLEKYLDSECEFRKEYETEMSENATVRWLWIKIK